MSEDVHHHSPSGADSLSYMVYQQTHKPALRCYQCGKCSAGCPLADEMDYPPSRIMRMLQTETQKFDEDILRSNTIWLCLTCETCSTRCPQEVEIPKIMDILRSESLRQNKINPFAKDIIAFHKSFLDTVKKTGRLYEIGLIGEYKMRTFHLLDDVAAAPKMFMQGKLKLIPHLVKNRSAIGQIFKKSSRKSGGKEVD